MGSLLPLRSKALLIELLVAIALSSAVIVFSGGITPQSYKNALIVAALVLVPLEALRQSGVLEHLVDLLRGRRTQSSKSLLSGGLTTLPSGLEESRDLPGHPSHRRPPVATVATGATDASNHEDDLLRVTRAPATDIIQRGDNLVIRAELPGVDPEDVIITLQNRVLTIFGEPYVDEEVEEERGEYYLKERRYGSFRRSITLPVDPHVDTLRPRLVHGVLEIVIQGAVAEQFPIHGYDEMNVEEVSQRLHDLSEEELQLVRTYEEHHKRRETLLKQLDRKIRAT